MVPWPVSIEQNSSEPDKKDQRQRRPFIATVITRPDVWCPTLESLKQEPVPLQLCRDIQ